MYKVYRITASIDVYSSICSEVCPGGVHIAVYPYSVMHVHRHTNARTQYKHVPAAHLVRSHDLRHSFS